jgi:hypothetical protein
LDRVTIAPSYARDIRVGFADQWFIAEINQHRMVLEKELSRRHMKTAALADQSRVTTRPIPLSRGAAFVPAVQPAHLAEMAMIAPCRMIAAAQEPFFSKPGASATDDSMQDLIS